MGCGTGFAGSGLAGSSFLISTGLGSSFLISAGFSPEIGFGASGIISALIGSILISIGFSSSFFGLRMVAAAASILNASFGSAKSFPVLNEPSPMWN